MAFEALEHYQRRIVGCLKTQGKKWKSLLDSHDLNSLQMQDKLLETNAALARLREESKKRAGRDETLVQLENEALRKSLVCDLCSDRYKDVIIRKCNHIFCKQCIKANLAGKY